jgi:hypothetical protein
MGSIKIISTITFPFGFDTNGTCKNPKDDGLRSCRLAFYHVLH